MKVSKEEAKFKPITLTIETLEEVQLIWHLLNTSTSTIAKRAEGHRIPCPNKDTYGMWKAYNRVVKDML